MILFVKDTKYTACNVCRSFLLVRNEFWSLTLTVWAQSYKINNNKTYHTRFWINRVGRWPGGKHVWWWIVRKGLNIEIKTYMIFMQNKQTDRQCSLPNLYQGYNILWCWGKEVNVIFTTFQQIDLRTLFVHSFISSVGRLVRTLFGGELSWSASAVHVFFHSLWPMDWDCGKSLFCLKIHGEELNTSEQWWVCKLKIRSHKLQVAWVLEDKQMEGLQWFHTAFLKPGTLVME